MVARIARILLGLNKMDLPAVVILLIFIAYSGTTCGQPDPNCDPRAAEECLSDRTQQFHGVLATLANNSFDTASYRQLCVTQVRTHDTCFDQKTRTCDPDDMERERNKWDALGRNITDMCLRDCPSIVQIANCKNMTDTSDFKLGLFEKFCRTFNSSLQCAKNVIQDCTFGMQFYADLLQRHIMLYWQHICNSGCQNLDETVLVITECAEHLEAVSSLGSELCAAHELFKQCVANSIKVCQEVMKIVRFKYKQYDIVDQRCRTTTTSTTTSTTTADVIATDDDVLTDLEYPDSTSTPVIPVSTGIEDIDECLDRVKEEMYEISGDVKIEQILLILQIESCFHNKTSDQASLMATMDNLDPRFTKFYQTVKKRGWVVLRESIEECNNWKGGSKDCSGHRYGLIPCSTAYKPLPLLGAILLTSAWATFVGLWH